MTYAPWASTGLAKEEEMTTEITWTFVDENGDALPLDLLEEYQVISQVVIPETKYRSSIVGLPHYGDLEIRSTVRRIPRAAGDALPDTEPQRRWIVLEAREVIAPGPGEALLMDGRRLGAKAMYGGEDARDCERRYQTLFSLVPEPPLTR